MKRYQQIASVLLARNNCSASGNTEWRHRHEDTIAATVKNHMPSGSGFDNGTVLDESSTPQRLVFTTSFHHMDDNGYYCGWSDHSVIVTPDLVFGFSLRVTGRNVRDIKDYIAEIFSDCLGRDIDDVKQAANAFA